MATILVAMDSLNPWFQLSAFFFLQALYFIYLSYHRPFTSKIQQLLEHINEVNFLFLVICVMGKQTEGEWIAEIEISVFTSVVVLTNFNFAIILLGSLAALIMGISKGC